MAPPPTLGGLGYNPEIPYAGFWIRFVSVIIDNVIVSIVGFVIILVVSFVIVGLSSATGSAPDLSSGGPATYLSYFISFCLNVGYFVYGWGMGSTFGQRVFHLAVVDAETGRPIGFGRAGIRYLGYLVSIFACYVGLIWAAFDPKKQGWHDKFANSVVIQG